MGVHLPRLSLEALGSDAQQEKVAVVELLGGAQYIVCVSQPAQREGVCVGMSLATALAMAPQLQVRTRDVMRERAFLERLAMRMQRFTPRVSIEPPDGLLLEVRGSLRLFGGVRKLLEALRAECTAAGATSGLAMAPTALAALAAARSGKPFLVADPLQLAGRLAPLPLAVLRWPEDVLERLTKIGVYTIGQALRLPRAGFAKRFGQEQLASLDRLMGRRADLRGNFQRRERFRRRHELLYEIEDHEAVLAVFASLLKELEEFLRSRQAGVTRLECRLWHRHAPPTCCFLNLAAPESDAERLAALLSERLAAISLPEPVRSCGLRSSLLVPRTPDNASLWQPGEQGGRVTAESCALIEHLRARLGVDAVYGLQLVPSHRPETSWRAVEPGLSAETASPPWPPFRRPLWLLSAPQLLKEIDGLPRYGGPLRLLGEPERIETGWWDEQDVTRDYYTAVDVRGVRMWIFRERTESHRWFLHGIFG